jgi:hypothetical protein
MGGEVSVRVEKTAGFQTPRHPREALLLVPLRRRPKLAARATRMPQDGRLPFAWGGRRDS